MRSVWSSLACYSSSKQSRSLVYWVVFVSVSFVDPSVALYTGQASVRPPNKRVVL